LIDPEKLYKMIESEGTTAPAVAEAIGVDNSTVYRWISRDRQHVSRHYLRALCAFLHCEPVEIIDVDLKDEPPQPCKFCDGTECDKHDADGKPV